LSRRFNGDGKADLATANSSSNNVTLLTNACVAAIIAIFDFTGDRRTDIGILSRRPRRFWALLGVGTPFSAETAT